MGKLSFEDYESQFETLFKRANPLDVEVIKRGLGYTSHVLGKGPTTTALKDSALKLLINVFFPFCTWHKHAMSGFLKTLTVLLARKTFIIARNHTTLLRGLCIAGCNGA